MAQNKLSPKQRKVAEMLANPSCMYNDTEIMNLCGVPRTSFYRWIRENEEFTAYINKLIDKYTDGELGGIWKALIARCKLGDVQAIKLYFELKGKYKQDITLSGLETVKIINDIPKETECLRG